MKPAREIANEVCGSLHIGVLSNQTRVEIRKAIAAAIEQRDRERTEELANLKREANYLYVRVAELVEANAELRQQIEGAHKKEKCPSCGSADFMFYGPPACPSCGAPNCCQHCCLKEAKRILWERLEEANRKLARAKEVLGPFKDMAELFARMGWEDIDDSHTAVSPLKLGQLRAAAALHAELVKGGKAG